MEFPSETSNVFAMSNFAIDFELFVVTLIKKLDFSMVSAKKKKQGSVARPAARQGRRFVNHRVLLSVKDKTLMSTRPPNPEAQSSR